MNLKQVLRLITLPTVVLLMLVYFYLNAYKLGMLRDASGMIVSGPAATWVSIKLGRDSVFLGRLPAADVFDRDGEKQMNFLKLAEDLLESAHESGKRLVVSIGEESAPALPIGNQGLLAAEFSRRIVTLVGKQHADAIMDMIHQERLQAPTLIECADQLACASINVDSEQWDPITGPYLSTDFSASRRGLPKGRWLFGPGTELRLQSEFAQTVQILVYLMSTVPQQQIQFQSEEIVKIREFPLTEKPRVAGGLLLFPRAFMFEMQLKQGSNPIKLVYSGWVQPTRQRPAPVAAYLTRFRIKTMGS